MKLNPEESILLEHLKKQVSDSRKLRWFSLAAGILLLLLSLGAYLYFLVSGNIAAAEKLSSNPMPYLMPIFAGFSFGQSFMGFKGDPQKELLIRTVESTVDNTNN